HIHALWEEIQHQAATTARGRCVPYIFTPHGMLDPWSLAQGRWKKRLYLAWRLRRDLDSAAAIHFTSERERELSSRLSLKPMTLVEPLGIDLAEFEDLPPRGEFRSAHSELAGKTVALFLGRLHQKKGLDVLIEAFAQHRVANAALVIAGPDDGYGATAQELVRRHRLSECV